MAYVGIFFVNDLQSLKHAEDFLFAYLDFILLKNFVKKHLSSIAKRVLRSRTPHERAKEVLSIKTYKRKYDYTPSHDDHFFPSYFSNT